MITYMMMLLLSGQTYYSLISSCPGLAWTVTDDTRYSDFFHWFEIFHCPKCSHYVSTHQPPATKTDPTTVLLDTSSPVWTLRHLHLPYTYTPLVHIGPSFNWFTKQQWSVPTAPWWTARTRPEQVKFSFDPEIPGKVISSSPQSIHPWVHRNKI